MERKTAKIKEEVNEVKVNPLRNEKVYVRFVPKDEGLPKNHVLSGGSCIDKGVGGISFSGIYRNELCVVCQRGFAVS